MKKTRKLLKLFMIALIAVTFIPCIGYAGGLTDSLTLEKSYPSDGQGGFEPVNMMVKLWFDGDVSDISVQEINKKAFNIKSPSGGAIKFDVLFNDEEKNRISLLPKNTLESNTEYTVTIDKSLKAADGRVLGASQDMTFQTRDVNAGNLSSMVMMLVMIVIMVGYSVISSKRQAEKEAKNQTEKVNPYKTAKQKNTSVEEVIKSTKKTQAKSNKGKSEKVKVNQDKTDNVKAKENGTVSPKTDENRTVSAKTNGSGTTAVKANKGKTGAIKTLKKKN